MRLIVLMFIFVLASYQNSYGFPEDRQIDGPFRIGQEWRTVVFDPPLRINQDGGRQKIHIVVDSDIYTPGDFDEELAYLYSEGGVRIQPEAVLISNDGEEVEVYPTSLVGLLSGGLALGYGKHLKLPSDTNLFDSHIKSFRSIKLRSDVPLDVDHLSWRVSSHPDLYRCNGRKCTWLENLFR